MRVSVDPARCLLLLAFLLGKLEGHPHLCTCHFHQEAHTQVHIDSPEA